MLSFVLPLVWIQIRNRTMENRIRNTDCNVFPKYRVLTAKRVQFFLPYYRDKTGTYCGLSLAPFFLEHLPQLEVLHLDGVDNVVVGGLAVAQQVRFRQGRIGALTLFSPGKEGYLGQGGGGMS